MSVLLRANAASNSKNKMSDDEMVDQVAYISWARETWSCVTHLSIEYRTFLSAGHDTSSKTLVWYFYAIAKHPEAQVRIREEIALVRARATGEKFTVADLNSMTYTLATLKVKLDLQLFFCDPESDDV